MLPVLAGQRAMVHSFHKLPKYFKLNEIQLILSERLKQDHYESWFLCNFLWQTGVRISEGLSLLYQDVDFMARTIKVVTLKRKSHERIIPIQPELLLELKLHQQFQLDKKTTRKKRDLRKIFNFNRATAYSYVRSACRFAGFNDSRAHPHCFRHSFAVNCLLHGVPITKLQQWLGHSNIMNTIIYTALAGREDHALLEVVDFGQTVIPSVVD
jgi:site-specific recombinase XerD